IPEVLDAIAAAGRAAGFEPTIRGGAAVGAVCFALPAEIDPAMVPGLVDEVRERLETRDGTAVIVHSPIREHLDVWGPVDPGALALMRRVKDQFDPGHRLSPGRFVAGI
ncbi:MAG: FAD-linked oxidase C-terminal domain-containing protein, partial [Stackebrandtia sp.]